MSDYKNHAGSMYTGNPSMDPLRKSSLPDKFPEMSTFEQAFAKSHGLQSAASLTGVMPATAPMIRERAKADFVRMFAKMKMPVESGEIDEMMGHREWVLSKVDEYGIEDFSKLTPEATEFIFKRMMTEFRAYKAAVARFKPGFAKEIEHIGFDAGSLSVFDEVLQNTKAVNAHIEEDWEPKSDLLKRYLKEHNINFARLSVENKRVCIDNMKRLVAEAHKRIVNDKDALLLEDEKLATEEYVLHARERIIKWSEGPLRLEKPQGSSLHHLLDFINSPKTHTHTKFPERQKSLIDKLNNDFKLNTYQIFVVEHDWGEAFGGAKDFDDVEYVLPYDHVCFEFRISGGRVICLVDEDTRFTRLAFYFDKTWTMDADEYYLTETGWYCLEYGTKKPIPSDEVGYNKVIDFAVKQIHAICLLREAEVVDTQQVGRPHGLNKQRAKQGKPAIPEYNVVVLGRKYSRGDGSRVGQGKGQGKALHWRRRHQWRKEGQGSEIIVPQMLVGNPDLGFVNKYYKV